MLTCDGREIEDRKEHRYDDAADNNAEEYDKHRLDERSQRGDDGIGFRIVEIGDFIHHAIDIAGLLPGLTHVFYHWREEGNASDGFRDLSTFRNRFRDSAAGIFDLSSAATGGNDFETTKNWNPASKQGRISAAKARKGDLLQEISKNRNSEKEIVLEASSFGGLDESGPELEGDKAASDDVENIAFEPIGKVDQCLGGTGQFLAEIGEHFGEHWDNENEQYINEDYGEADNSDGVGHR